MLDWRSWVVRPCSIFLKVFRALPFLHNMVRILLMNAYQEPQLANATTLAAQRAAAEELHRRRYVEHITGGFAGFWQQVLPSQSLL